MVLEEIIGGAIARVKLFLFGISLIIVTLILSVTLFPLVDLYTNETYMTHWWYQVLVFTPRAATIVALIIGVWLIYLGIRS